MNILIIGNGFDLAHGLPTKYSDFLDFFNILTKYYMADASTKKQILDDAINSKNLHKNIISYLETDFISRLNKDDIRIFETMNDYLTNNIWYDYFKYLYKQNKIKGINWIDFECEISMIIEIFDSIEKNINKPFLGNDFLQTNIDLNSLKKGINNNEFIKTTIFNNISLPIFEYNDDFIDKVSIFTSKINLMSYYETNNFTKDHIFTYNEFINKSYTDLNRFIYSMELYLIECVGAISPRIISPDINKLDINALLSFNYTKTFENIYKNTANAHYIHGKINSIHNLKSNNMVLGIDEYYKIEIEKNTHTNYNIYKKFTQRIIKDTGFEYRNWISQMNEETNLYIKNKTLSSPNNIIQHNIYIFGHSLDITDKDILKEFIDRKDTKTTIYYRNNQQQTQQIANLVKVLGQNRFIEMINNVPQQICFIKQQEMIEKNK